MIFRNKQFYGRFIGQPISAQKLFCDLPAATKKRLNSICRQKNALEGEIITEDNEFSNKIFVLQSGQAEMRFKNNLNKKNTVRLVENNEIIGLTQFISDSPNQINIVTLTPCLWDFFPAQDFLQLLNADCQLCFRLSQIISSDIQKSYLSFLDEKY